MEKDYTPFRLIKSMDDFDRDACAPYLNPISLALDTVGLIVIFSMVVLVLPFVVIVKGIYAIAG